LFLMLRSLLLLDWRSLLHTGRLWFEWSSFLSHLFYNSCCLELWKITTIINTLRN
jgi:hypothetical protein